MSVSAVLAGSPAGYFFRQQKWPYFVGGELGKETLLFPIFALLTPKPRWQIMSCGHVIVPKLLGRGEAPFELENSGVNQKSGVARRSPSFPP